MAVGYTGCIWSHRKILRSHSNWAICLGVRLPTGSSVTKTSRARLCLRVVYTAMATTYPGAPAICCIWCSRVIYRDGSFIQDLLISMYGQHVRWWPLPPRKYPRFEHGWSVGRGYGLRVEGALGFIGLLKVNFKRYDSSRCDRVHLP